MKSKLITLTLIAVSAQAASLTGVMPALNTVRPEKIQSLHQGPPVRHYALLASMGFMAAGQMLDCASSIGGHETNGMIGNGRNGQFNAAKGFSIKGGMVGGIVFGEYWAHRKYGHGLDAVMAGANATMGGIGVLAAAHNYGVKK